LEAAGTAVAIVIARNEERSLPSVLAGLPGQVAGVPLTTMVVDDGSTDRTAALARAAGARVVSHNRSLGLGAALRTGISEARSAGHVAAVYLDGDGEYDSRQAGRLLEPVLARHADYVLGSRFTGTRLGMARHRDVSNRVLTAMLNGATGLELSDWQTGYRAFSRAALAAARIRHDYNYAQVLTLALWGAGVEPWEVPVDYRRRTHGNSFIRHGEYLRRAGPATWAEYLDARSARRRARGRSPSAAPRPSPRRS
jgi:glycosyltransferase involved in cell wall biosynthesis